MDDDDEFENALLSHFGQMLNSAEHSDSDNGVPDVYLKHFGVKGMKWGQRKQRETNREVRTDLKEQTRARRKMGKGSGTRQRQAKATIDAKLANDPVYAKAYNDYLEQKKKGPYKPTMKQAYTMWAGLMAVSAVAMIAADPELRSAASSVINKHRKKSIYEMPGAYTKPNLRVEQWF